MAMRVLITGGTGFLGSNLALRYARDGHQVRVLAKEATDAERQNANDLRAVGVEVVRGDVRDGDLVQTVCQGVDVVQHIAAAMREANISKREFWDVNLQATRHLLEVARQAGVRRFVYCSSIGAMGKNMPKPADEETPCNPQDIYQRTKKAAEELCLDFQRSHGLPLAVIRPADVYGPRDRRLLRLFRSIKKGRFALIGTGKNEHHMVYVDDLVQGFLLAAELEAALGQIFIIAGERAVRLDRLVAAIADQLGVPTPKLRVPLWPVQALAAVVEGICAPLRIQPPLYRRRVDFFRSDYAFDIAKAKRLLGYLPEYNLERGLAQTLAWYRQQDLI